MKKIYTIIMGSVITLTVFLLTEKPVFASDGDEYITISVEATDDNAGLQYALDSNAEEAFSSKNEFSVIPGTSHTIYVKDAAGNITSQEYTPSVDVYVDEQATDGDSREVNIDVLLDEENKGVNYPKYEYAGDLLSDPAEAGQGTVYDRVLTDTSDSNAERLFYTVTAKDGEVFYLMIDQDRNSNNVYLLDQVNLSDLKSLAYSDTSEKSESLLSALSEEKLTTETNLAVSEAKQNEATGSSNKRIIYILVAVIGGGAYYYLKVYKNKKDEQMDLMDAMDKEDFMIDDEDMDEEADFGLDDDYQEQTLAMLLEDEDSFLLHDDELDDDYATSHSSYETAHIDEYDADLDSPDEENEDEDEEEEDDEE